MNSIEKAWYKGAAWLYLLLPLSWLFQLLATVRKAFLKRHAARVKLSKPLIVVGNITVGGTGKTPLIITLARYFQEQGIRPGLISRGYGSQSTEFPLAVTAETDVKLSGDEAKLLAELTACPVVIDPDRLQACQYLLREYDVDVVLSDDGLQHYGLPRDIEIVMVDAQRLFGNGLCLPAGPLRESPARLQSVDYVIVNGDLPEGQQLAVPVSATMSLQPRYLVNLESGEKRPYSGAPFKMGDQVQAVAGIGNPDRFFSLLESLPYPVEHFPFPDHHNFTVDDFNKAGINLNQPIVMTEKDGIKCRTFANNNFWVLEVEVALAPEFLDNLRQRIQ